MKCSVCGNEFFGSFCNSCGHAAEKDIFLEQRTKASFREPNENLLSVLGADAARNFFSTGVLDDGFAMLSDKRVYFKGRCCVRTGETFVKNTVDQVVDLKDVRDTGFVHKQTPILTALYRLFFVLSCVVYFSWPFWIIYYVKKAEWAKKVAWGIQCLFWIMPIFYILNKENNYSLFEVSHIGGGTAIPITSDTRADAYRMQKALQEAKAEAQRKKGMAQNATHVPLVDSGKQKSVPELLKEYKEMLDNGSITQAEFDARKKELFSK